MRRGGLFQSRRTSARRAAALSYVLDQLSVGARAAYSIRRLRSGYAGPLIRLRRSSDNAELDFSASGEYVDKAAILAWVGSGDGTVVLAYDQSGNGHNAVPGGSPTVLVRGGVWLNGFCKASTNPSALQIPTAAFSGVTSLSVSTIYRRVTENPAPHNIGGIAANPAYHYPWGDGVIYSGFGLTNRLPLSPGGIPNAGLSMVITDSVSSSGLLRVFFDGSQVASMQGTFAVPVAREFPGGKQYGEAVVRELILFDAELSVADRGALTANQYAVREGI